MSSFSSFEQVVNLGVTAFCFEALPNSTGFPSGKLPIYLRSIHPSDAGIQECMAIGDDSKSFPLADSLPPCHEQERSSDTGHMNNRNVGPVTTYPLLKGDVRVSYSLSSVNKVLQGK